MSETTNLIDSIKEKILSEIEQKTGMKTRYQVVKKNNGIELTGLLILDDTTNCSPNIYIDAFIEDILNKKLSIEEASEQIINIYEKHKLSSNVDFSWVYNWDIVKNSLYIKLFNLELNKEGLEERVYKKIFDLAAVVYIRI